MLVFRTKWIFDLRIILMYLEIFKNKYYQIITLRHCLFFFYLFIFFNWQERTRNLISFKKTFNHKSILLLI